MVHPSEGTDLGHIGISKFGSDLSGGWLLHGTVYFRAVRLGVSRRLHASSAVAQPIRSQWELSCFLIMHLTKTPIVHAA